MSKAVSKKRMEVREPVGSHISSTPPKKPRPVAKDSAGKPKQPAARRKLLAKVQEKPVPKPATNEDISSNWKSFLQVNSLMRLGVRDIHSVIWRIILLE